jgi:hypothetical protein
MVDVTFVPHRGALLQSITSFAAVHEGSDPFREMILPLVRWRVPPSLDSIRVWTSGSPR